MEALTPYVERLLLQENSPVAWARRFGKAVPDLLWLATGLPRQVRQLLAVLLSVSHPGGSALWSWVLTIGFAVAAVLGLYLVWNIFRSGRH